MTSPVRARFSRSRAFSLVEMLVVIAVIGIVSAIGIPLVHNALGRSDEAAAQRNAQIVAAMAGQALHAGNTTLIDAPTKKAAVELLASGVSGTGNFSNIQFRFVLSPGEQERVSRFLRRVDGLLVVNLTAP